VERRVNLHGDGRSRSDRGSAWHTIGAPITLASDGRAFGTPAVAIGSSGRGVIALLQSGVRGFALVAASLDCHVPPVPDLAAGWAMHRRRPGERPSDRTLRTANSYDDRNDSSGIDPVIPMSGKPGPRPEVVRAVKELLLVDGFQQGGVAFPRLASDARARVIHAQGVTKKRARSTCAYPRGEQHTESGAGHVPVPVEAAGGGSLRGVGSQMRLPHWSSKSQRSARR
jgi:hypothetical protein